MIMKNEVRHRKITDLMALMVFGLFALCVLLVLLTGADVYRNLVDRGAQAYESRTASQYVATRVRQADFGGGISVEEFGGQDALVLREQINGKTYLTRVYCCEGFIRELFTADSGEFSPEDGEKILEAEAMSFTLEQDLLTARIILADGRSQALTLYLRSGEGERP